MVANARTCEGCGYEIQRQGQRGRHPKYCSPRCRGHVARRGDKWRATGKRCHAHVCPMCRRTFYSIGKSRKYCSYICSTKSRSPVNWHRCQWCEQWFCPTGNDRTTYFQGSVCRITGNSGRLWSNQKGRQYGSPSHMGDMWLICLIDYIVAASAGRRFTIDHGSRSIVARSVG